VIRYSATALLASLGFAAAVSGRAVPGPAPSPRFSDVTLATGVRLRYAEQGDPRGPAVVLLHGYSDSLGIPTLIPSGDRDAVFAERPERFARLVRFLGAEGKGEGRKGKEERGRGTR
jgi:hypothetical protein